MSDNRRSANRRYPTRSRRPPRRLQVVLDPRNELTHYGYTRERYVLEESSNDSEAEEGEVLDDVEDPPAETLRSREDDMEEDEEEEDEMTQEDAEFVVDDPEVEMLSDGEYVPSESEEEDDDTDDEEEGEEELEDDIDEEEDGEEEEEEDEEEDGPTYTRSGSRLIFTIPSQP